VLEEEVQKREAEIRLHFRIAQEQRIYEQELQGKIELLNKKLKEVTANLQQCEEVRTNG
jgi:hypothetical protein